jgi:hypothetical protein
MPYKKVIAVGDSFTRGDELANCPQQLHEYLFPFTYSQSTWPALVAKLLDCDYECYALGGIGNQWMSWKTGGKLEQDTLVIVNWTWFERFDYIDTDIVKDVWTTTHPRHEDKLNQYFYRNLDSDIWNLHRNLQQMHSAISLLKQHNVNFIMTCLDSDYCADFDTFRPPGSNVAKHWETVITNLQAQVVPHILNFDGMTFLEWSKHKNFQFGPNGHPLEKAHAEAAKYINTHIIEGKNNGH